MSFSKIRKITLDFLVVIPARMASSRLPGKPLIDLGGKTLLERTYERCKNAVAEEKIIIATDHKNIEHHCKVKGMNVIMTSENCLTGTDRVAEVAMRIKADSYINVQGDEPLINPDDIIQTIKTAQEYPDEVINGYADIENEKQYRSETIPKVVFRPDGRLLYMSRSPIPGNKKSMFKESWRQICVYAFPRKTLFEYTSIGNKSRLESHEDIEILRFLEMGYDVRMIPLSKDSVAVDTPGDVDKVMKILKVREGKG